MENKFNLASSPRRIIAFLVDGLLFTLLTLIVSYIVKGSFDRAFIFIDSKYWDAIYTLYLTILPVVWGGYIVGKKIFHIKVVQVNGEKVTFQNMLLRELVGRYLLGVVSFGITFIVSFFMIIFRKDKRSLHDLLGGTIVVPSKNKLMHYSSEEEVLTGDRETIKI